MELDAPAVDYVPEFTVDADADLVPAITIRHLLTQTSGLPPGWSGTIVEDWPVHGDAALEDYLLSPEFSSRHHLVAPPGEVLLWSGLGDALMALVVERVSGEYYADYMRDHVLDPLGMTRTTFRPEEVEADGDFAIGVDDTRRWAPADFSGGSDPWVRPILAWTTLSDLSRLAQFFLHGNEAVLSQALFDEAVSAQVPLDDWGFLHRSFVHEVSDHLCVLGACPAQGDLEHVFEGGDWAGHTNLMSAIPSRDFAVVQLGSRLNYFDQSAGLAVTELLDVPAVEDLPGDDHDPGVYVGRYSFFFGNAPGTVRVTLREDGSLRLSSPQCTLAPRGPGVFGCEGHGDMTFLFDDSGAVKYLRSGTWVATRDPDDAGGGQ